MRSLAQIMGMPVAVDIVDPNATQSDIGAVVDCLTHFDEVFSTYKDSSEMSRINRCVIPESAYSDEMRLVLAMCEETKRATRGYFDIRHGGGVDPSGLVKGLAISSAADVLLARGFVNFFIEIAGDAQVHGRNASGERWRVGIQNPFDLQQFVEVVHLSDRGIATSGNSIRGEHIHDPVRGVRATEIASMTVVGPTSCDADRFATAAFAMGEEGISFIEALEGFEGYMITSDMMSRSTSGFDQYTCE